MTNNKTQARAVASRNNHIPGKNKKRKLSFYFFKYRFS